MAKSADAFRTISEVADWLGSPAHVLRFWESKFTQVKPVKRAGGRRYYRPADMLLLGGIKKLLHDDGMTIKGVQKVLREQGVKYVSSLSDPLDGDLAADLDGSVIEDAVSQETQGAPSPANPAAPADPAATEAKVLPFQRELEAAVEQYSEEIEDEETSFADSTAGVSPPAAVSAQDEDETTAKPVVSSDVSAPDDEPVTDFVADEVAPVETTETDEVETEDASRIEDFAEPALAAPDFEPDPEDKPALLSEIGGAVVTETDDTEPTAEIESLSTDPETSPSIPSFLAESTTQAPTPEAVVEDDAGVAADDDAHSPSAQPDEDLPGTAVPGAVDPDESEQPPETSAAGTPPVASPPRARTLDLPPDPGDDDIIAPPGILSRIAALEGRGIATDRRPDVSLLRDRLAAIRSRSGGAETHP